MQTNANKSVSMATSNFGKSSNFTLNDMSYLDTCSCQIWRRLVKWFLRYGPKGDCVHDNDDNNDDNNDDAGLKWVLVPHIPYWEWAQKGLKKTQRIWFNYSKLWWKFFFVFLKILALLWLWLLFIFESCPVDKIGLFCASESLIEESKCCYLS